MHELYVCTNSCCRRFRADYKAVVEEIAEGKIGPVGLSITERGLRACNFCKREVGWKIAPCEHCGAPFGAVPLPPSVAHDAGSLVQCEVCDWFNDSDANECARCTVHIRRQV